LPNRGRTVEALAPRYTVIAVDLPGFGRSAKPRARYSLGFFANALGGFLDGLGWGRSRWSATRWRRRRRRLLADASTRVERLALIGAVVPGFYRPSLQYRFAVLPVLGDLLALGRSARALQGGHRALLPHARPRRGRLPRRSRLCGAHALGRASRLSHDARDSRADLVVRAADYRRAIAMLDAPVLFVHGRQDNVIPAECCRQARAGFRVLKPGGWMTVDTFRSSSIPPS